MMTSFVWRSRQLLVLLISLITADASSTRYTLTTWSSKRGTPDWRTRNFWFDYTTTKDNCYIVRADKIGNGTKRLGTVRAYFWNQQNTFIEITSKNEFKITGLDCFVHDLRKKDEGEIRKNPETEKGTIKLQTSKDLPEFWAQVKLWIRNKGRSIDTYVVAKEWFKTIRRPFGDRIKDQEIDMGYVGRVISLQRERVFSNGISTKCTDKDDCDCYAIEWINPQKQEREELYRYTLVSFRNYYDGHSIERISQAACECLLKADNLTLANFPSKWKTTARRLAASEGLAANQD